MAEEIAQIAIFDVHATWLTSNPLTPIEVARRAALLPA